MAAVVAGTACTDDRSEADTDADGVEVVEASPGGLLAAADNAGASEEQLEILQSGDISFAEYEQAVNRTIACLREAGIDVVGGQVTETRGFPEITYSFAGSSDGRTDEQTLALADECINRHSGFVEAQYQTSPAALEAQDARFEPFRAAVVECIRDNGGEVGDDGGREEVLLSAYAVQEQSGVDCLAESGYLP